MPEAGPRTIRIVLVDDHALFRNALAQDLGKEEDFEIAGTSGSVKEALELVKNEPWTWSCWTSIWARRKAGISAAGSQRGLPRQGNHCHGGVHYWKLSACCEAARPLFSEGRNGRVAVPADTRRGLGRAAPPPSRAPNRRRGDHRQAGAPDVDRSAAPGLAAGCGGKANKEIAGIWNFGSQVKERFRAVPENRRPHASPTDAIGDREILDEVAAFPPMSRRHLKVDRAGATPAELFLRSLSTFVIGIVFADGTSGGDVSERHSASRHHIPPTPRGQVSTMVT